MQRPAGADEKTGRRALPIILIVLATVIGVLSVFALWAKRQLLETETWTTTSEELIQNAEIQEAVSTFIVTAIFDNVDVEAVLAERLPPQVKPLAGPAAGALRGAADDVALRALEQPKVQGLWVQATAAAQSRLIALIEDEGEFVATTGGVVTVDLKSLLESVTAQLGIGAGLVDRLPPEASSIEVMDSSELEAAQKGVNFLQTVGYVLTALTLVLYAAAIVLAGDRRRTTLRSVGLSFIVVGAIVLFARGAAGDLVVDSLSDAASSDAAVSATFEIGTSLMLETGQSIVAYGIVIVLAAWLAGPTRSATSIRHALTPWLRQPAYAYGGLAALFLLLFWWDPVVATHRLVPSLLLVAFAAIGVEMLRRQVIREFPGHVTTGSPAGIAQALAERMREGRERRIAQTPAAARDERLGDIERLAGLRDSGALTEEEFAAEKARILASAPS
jgi:Short C-terminal domain